MQTKTAALERYLREPVLWSRTSDPNFPWHGLLKRVDCRVRINDFPQEPLYTLLVDGKEVGDFDDWPACWKKGERGLVGSEKPSVAVVK